MKQGDPSVSRETRSALDVSRETQTRLEAFAALLLQWNARINLVSRADASEVWSRHIADSLQLLPLIPSGVSEATDLGSGGGFPGLILAIATGIRFTLVEADHRKAAFLREAARVTSAPAHIVVARIETADVPPAPLLTARALAPLPNLLHLAARFLAPGGTALFPKGANAEQELTAAMPTWNMTVERFASRTDPAGLILRLTDIARAGGGSGPS